MLFKRMRMRYLTNKVERLQKHKKIIQREIFKLEEGINEIIKDYEKSNEEKSNT